MIKMMVNKLEIPDYRKFNSMTKYGSIETYHKFDKEGKRGLLLPELTFDIPKGVDIEGTEKINGTNGRIPVIFHPEGYDYFIGSREELYYACGDRVFNPQLGIVETIQGLDIQARIFELYTNIYDGVIDLPYGIYDIFGEVYGGDINGYKHYTSDKNRYGFRVFDIAYIPFDEFNHLNGNDFHISAVASWRDHGGQTFLSTEQRTEVCKILGLETVPFLFTMKSDDLPITFEEAKAFLDKYSVTRAGMGANGLAEGVVIRTKDRNIIAKIREEDIRRTLDSLKQGAKQGKKDKQEV
jgi:hypothetical protein